MNELNDLQVTPALLKRVLDDINARKLTSISMVELTDLVKRFVDGEAQIPMNSSSTSSNPFVTGIFSTIKTPSSSEGQKYRRNNDERDDNIDKITLGMRRSSLDSDNSTGIKNSDPDFEIQSEFNKFNIGSVTHSSKPKKGSKNRSSKEFVPSNNSSEVKETKQQFSFNFSISGVHSTPPVFSPIPNANGIQNPVTNVDDGFLPFSDPKKRSSVDANTISPNPSDKCFDFKDNVNKSLNFSTDVNGNNSTHSVNYVNTPTAQDSRDSTSHGINAHPGESIPSNSQDSEDKRDDTFTFENPMNSNVPESSTNTQQEVDQAESISHAFNIGLKIDNQFKGFKIGKKNVKRSKGKKTALHVDDTADLSEDGDNNDQSPSKQNSRKNVDTDIDWQSESMKFFLPDERHASSTQPPESAQVFPKDFFTFTNANEPSLDDKMASVADMYRKQGRDLYDTEEYESALDAFDKALQQAPVIWIHRITVLANRAATLIMLGRLTEAVDVCTQAISLNPNSAKLYCRKGRALIRLGHLSSATESFQRAADIASLKNSRSTESDTENKKLFDEAMAHMKIISNLNSQLMSLSNKETLQEHYNVIQIANELLVTCTHFRIAQIAKVKALIKLKRWTEAKEFIENITVTLPLSMHALYAHESIKSLSTANPPSSANIPTSTKSLQWYETPGSSSISINIINIAQAILCMGWELGELYLTTLKNQSISRNKSTEVMTHIKNILSELKNVVFPFTDRDSKWEWIRKCQLNLDILMSNKSSGDSAFRATQYSVATVHYSAALKADPDAHIWNAILLSNRAAAYMHKGQNSLALEDCNEALDCDGYYFKAKLRRARVHRGLNDLEASIVDYEAYLASNPTDRLEVESELRTVKEQLAEKKNPRRPHFASTSSSSRRYNNHKPTHKPSKFYNPLESDDDEWEDIQDDFSNPFFFQSTRNSHAKTSSTFDDFRKNRTNPGRGAWEKDHRPSSSSSQSGQSKPHNGSRSSGGKPAADDYYGQLNVSSKASDREITIAYRKLALLYHPDKNKDPAAEDIFKAVTSAYAVLSDKTARYRYDLTRPN